MDLNHNRHSDLMRSKSLIYKTVTKDFGHLYPFWAQMIMILIDAKLQEQGSWIRNTAGSETFAAGISLSVSSSHWLPPQV